MPAPNVSRVSKEASDADLVRRALARDGQAFRAIMTRYNQRLYRLARGIVGRASEAEDVVQEAYVRAFRNLDTFRGDSALSTWLSRIVINEALGRLRKQKREGKVTDLDAAQAEIIQFPGNASDDPERTMAQRQILHLVEEATDKLPAAFRSVFVARVIEGLSMEETAELLGIKPETVKTRLHRARQMVRKEIDARIGPVLMDAFPFAGRRCDRLKDAVMRRLGIES
jgi:RNA polymerase sigma-70 factor (ECF subfamily)